MNFDLWHYSSDVAVLYSREYDDGGDETPIRISQDYYREDILWKIESTYAENKTAEFAAGTFSTASFGIIIKR